jgi:hypothetical protein
VETFARPSHGENRGSSPLGSANDINTLDPRYGMCPTYVQYTGVDTTGRSSRACTAAELVSPASFDHRSQTRWHSVDLVLAFRSSVRALAMSESHGVGDQLRGVLWSIRLRIWGSGVRISSGAP